MITREHTTGRWFVVARHYPTALMARAAWERGNKQLVHGPDEMGIGIMRLGPVRGEGIETGAPENVHPVVVVTQDKHGARKAERLLAGSEWEPTTGFVDALILRRVRAAGAAAAANPGKSGRLVIRRPEQRGATLDPSGIVHEQEPGRG